MATGKEGMTAPEIPGPILNFLVLLAPRQCPAMHMNVILGGVPADGITSCPDTPNLRASPYCFSGFPGPQELTLLTFSSWPFPVDSVLHNWAPMTLDLGTVGSVDSFLKDRPHQSAVLCFAV